MGLRDSAGIKRACNTTNGFDRWCLQHSPKEYQDEYAGRDVVYLTADSDTVLDALSPDAVYVIGGIVDRNRHKGLCVGKAKNQGIRTARLPLERVLGATKVLTVNQVYSALLEMWGGDGDGVKVASVVPQRRLAHLSQSNHCKSGVRRVEGAKWKKFGLSYRELKYVLHHRPFRPGYHRK